jgi:hypothetical protein
MRGGEPFECVSDCEPGDLRTGDDSAGSPEGLRYGVKVCLVAHAFRPAIARVEGGRHRPRRFTGRNNSDILIRKTIENALRERTADQPEGIDIGNPCTKNLLQVSA